MKHTLDMEIFVAVRQSEEEIHPITVSTWWKKPYKCDIDNVSRNIAI